jgi:hypothetical protein
MNVRLPRTPKEMFPGIVGEVVSTFEPHTEAAPVAIAAQFIVAFGNAAGGGPHFHIGETRHGVNENVVLVGKTSRSRKGDSRAAALRPLQDADPDWCTNVTSGLSTGEGLIHAVRDRVEKIDKEGERVVIDEGIADKRLLVCETEFANPLKQFKRETNILSCILRDAWDGKPVLRTLTKTSPTRATAAHISIIGHATPADLTEYLADVEAANGLGNRFMFVLVDRVKRLPDPGRADTDTVEMLSGKVRALLEHARTVGTLQRTAAASALWRSIYAKLSTDQPGLLGSLLARSEAHVARLSALFALLAHASSIDEVHLLSALAFWDYVEASTKIIFADRTGNDAADRIRGELLPGQSLALSEIREEIFANHVSAGRLSSAINLLVELGEMTTHSEETAGRSRLIVTRLTPAPAEETAPRPEKANGQGACP